MQVIPLGSQEIAMKTASLNQMHQTQLIVKAVAHHKNSPKAKIANAYTSIPTVIVLI